MNQLTHFDIMTLTSKRDAHTPIKHFYMNGEIMYRATADFEPNNNNGLKPFMHVFNGMEHVTTTYTTIIVIVVASHTALIIVK